MFIAISIQPSHPPKNETDSCVQPSAIILSNQKYSESTNLRRPGGSRFRTLKPDPDRHQNCITWSLSHALPLQKISSKSVHKFASNLTDRQTNRQTNRPNQKHNLLLRRRYQVISANADKPHDAASCQIKHIVLHTMTELEVECIHQAYVNIDSTLLQRPAAAGFQHICTQ